MKNVNTFGIQVVIRKHRFKNEETPIYDRITANSNRCEISVKRKISVDNWRNGKRMAKGKNSDISVLNSYLEQIRSQHLILLLSCNFRNYDHQNGATPHQNPSK
jgi:hypothetical protein